MDYSWAMERHDFSKIDKLNNLNSLRTFWDDVRKLTKNVTSDHSIGRWQCLAEARFREVQQEALANYNYFRNALRSKLSASTMDLVDMWITGRCGLPTYDMDSDTIEDAKYLKNMYNILKEHSLL